MSPEVCLLLERFVSDNNILTKGPLSIVVQLTHMFADKTFPLNSEDYKTERGGQVLGMGGANLKKILAEYGISKKLSAEGGRTSRGSIAVMEAYVRLLNELNARAPVDFEELGKYWAGKVRSYFERKPLPLKIDPAKTISSNFQTLFDEVRKRQEGNTGTQYLGAVLQHLVAAKLCLILPSGRFDIHGASVADAPTNRCGDFVVGDAVIHCTTAPGTPLLEKCQRNLDAGLRPVIITLPERVRTALDLAADNGLEGRVEVWDIQQFLSANIHERGLFSTPGQIQTVNRIVEKYNEIVELVENDPSLNIDLG